MMMRADWTLTIPPIIEAVSLSEAKRHCRIDHGDEDELFDLLRRSARMHAEDICGRGFLSQTWKTVVDDWWSDVLWLPRAAPLQSVSHVKYYDAAGVLTTLSSSLYVVDVVSEPACLSWLPTFSPPALQSGRRGAIEVTYVVGWSSAVQIPAAIRQAMLLMIGHWYQDREAVIVSVGGTAVPLPIGVDALLAPYRVWWRPPCQR